MSLVLYYAPWSSATTCLLAIDELGVPCERVKLDLAAGSTRTPDFLAKNPNGKVPLLVHDGVPIFESIAILAHLGATFGVEKKLFPPPGLARAQALQWLAWMNASLAPHVSRYIENSSDRVAAELRNAKVAELARAEINHLLGILDAHLAGKTWMVGEHFTLVDLHLAGGMAWISRLGFELATLPNVAAWLARCQARPSFAALRAA